MPWETAVILEEIISPLTADGSVSLSMRLEVDADADAGFTKDTIRAVTENCRSLKLQFGFDENTH